jgi:competence protein ComEC
VRDARTSGSIAGWATLVSDPAWRRGGLQVDVRFAGRRYQATATGEPASVLAPLLAGERVEVHGDLRRVTGRGREALARRHVGARLQVARIARVDRGGAVPRFSNTLRRTLGRGISSMAPDERALFMGIVLGDDREQSAIEVDDFRAAGLSHLLAVSGQNVAFLLAIAAPLLSRLRLRGRLVGGLAVLIGFGVLTRWEPSVLRAVAMAGLALLATTLGRPASSVRLLGLAVIALVLVDPMLAGAVGFLLSVGACAGIALLAPWLERRLPAPLAVTLAAQVGVAPVLLPIFGGIPFVSLPANLLAVPAAGPLMMWGLAAGLPAGLVGGRFATVLHLPNRALLWWIATVAHRAARLPLPQLTARWMPALAAGGVAVVLIRRARARPRVSASVLLVAALLVGGLAVSTRSHQPDGREITRGARLWAGGGAVVVEVSGADPGQLLEALRQAGVRRVDLLVLRSGGSSAARLAEAVRHRGPVRLTLAPVGHHVPGAQVLAPGQSVSVGPYVARCTANRPRLTVRIGSTR